MKKALQRAALQGFSYWAIALILVYGIKKCSKFIDRRKNTEGALKVVFVRKNN